MHAYMNLSKGAGCKIDDKEVLLHHPSGIKHLAKTSLPRFVIELTHLNKYSRQICTSYSYNLRNEHQ